MTGLTATATDSTIALTWQPSAGAVDYWIDCHVADLDVAATTYTDTGLSPGTSYTYTVYARDSGGNYTTPGASITQSTTGTPPTPDAALLQALQTAYNGESDAQKKANLSAYLAFLKAAITTQVQDASITSASQLAQTLQIAWCDSNNRTAGILNTRKALATWLAGRFGAADFKLDVASRTKIAAAFTTATTALAQIQQPPSTHFAKAAPNYQPWKGPRHPRGRVSPPANLRQGILGTQSTLPQDLPTITAKSWDCRDLGFVGPIRDQGDCGSCWDFSGTRVVRDALAKAGVLPTSLAGCLSEQYTLDCGKNGGCDGDDNTTVLAWAKATGLPLDSAYGPYTASSGRCKSGTYELYKIDDWGYADGEDGKDRPKKLKTPWPITARSVRIAADNNFENWTPPKPWAGDGSRNIDHDVAIVGWVDDASVKGGGYWIMANSWNTTWGISGYMLIAYGDRYWHRNRVGRADYHESILAYLIHQSGGHGCPFLPLE